VSQEDPATDVATLVIGCPRTVPSHAWRVHASPLTIAHAGSQEGCLICSEQRGDVDVPGGVLDDGAVLTFHRPPLEEEAVFAGHLLVTPRRHVLDFAALELEESALMGIAIAKYSRLLKQLGAARVYVATVGHHVDHLHVHLLPRWPETPADVPWHSVDDWDGARRATAADIEEMIAKLHQ